MDAKQRRGRVPEGPQDGAEAIQEGAQGLPGEEPVDGKPQGRKVPREVVKRVNVTLSFSEDFARLLAVVSASMGVDRCELVETLVRPALKGVRQPTIPDDLKRLMKREGAAAI